MMVIKILEATMSTSEMINVSKKQLQTHQTKTQRLETLYISERKKIRVWVIFKKLLLIKIILTRMKILLPPKIYILALKRMSLVSKFLNI